MNFNEIFNGKTKWIFTLFGVIVIGLSAIIHFAFANITENRKRIREATESVNYKIDCIEKENNNILVQILQRLARIETKIENIDK